MTDEKSRMIDTIGFSHGTKTTPHVQPQRPPVLKNHEWFWWRRVMNRYQSTLSGRPPHWDAGAWTAVRVNAQGLVDFPYHDKPILADSMGGEWWSEPLPEPPNVEPLPHRCEHCGQLCRRETPIETPPGPSQVEED